MGEHESARICLTSARSAAGSSELRKSRQARLLSLKAGGQKLHALAQTRTDENALSAVRQIPSFRVGKGRHEQGSGMVGGLSCPTHPSLGRHCS